MVKTSPRQTIHEKTCHEYSNQNGRLSIGMEFVSVRLFVIFYSWMVYAPQISQKSTRLRREVVFLYISKSGYPQRFRNQQRSIQEPEQNLHGEIGDAARTTTRKPTLPYP